MPRRYSARVVSRARFGGLVELSLDLGDAIDAMPGQFVHVRCDTPGTVLRRPYSIAGAAGGTITIMVREVGAGSAWLCSVEAGETLDVMAPLGRGFSLDEAYAHVLLAGGTGIAPMRFLASRLSERAGMVKLLWGVEGKDEFGGMADELKGNFDLLVSAMDGSAGEACSVVDLLKGVDRDGTEALYACGPRGMLNAFAECIKEEELAVAQVCMEERMACGIGACRGCAVPAASLPGAYLAVCRDGPVFRGRELDWSRMSE